MHREAPHLPCLICLSDVTVFPVLFMSYVVFVRCLSCTVIVDLRKRLCTHPRQDDRRVQCMSSHTADTKKNWSSRHAA